MPLSCQNARGLTGNRGSPALCRQPTADAQGKAPVEAVQGADVVLTMLYDGGTVLEVMRGPRRRFPGGRNRRSLPRRRPPLSGRARRLVRHCLTVKYCHAPQVLRLPVSLLLWTYSARIRNLLLTALVRLSVA